jgi:putative addiction module component (TIGR02574 family)
VPPLEEAAAVLADVGVAMTDPVLELAERGRALPPEERVRLLDLLLESLQESTPSDVQEAWDKEIERRIAAHERGEVKVYDLDEVMDEARRLAP